jgi:hypothetical protein
MRSVWFYLFLTCVGASLFLKSAAFFLGRYACMRQHDTYTCHQVFVPGPEVAQ